MPRIITKVSVIIPTYNEQRDISACLSSLLAQDYPNFEIIVVDDGSLDSTLSHIQKFPVKIVKQSHLGAGAARNLGAKHAHGQILVFVDADMTFVPSFLHSLVRPIIDQKTIGTFSKDELVSNPDNLWSRCWSIAKGAPPGKLHPSNYPDTQPVFRAILKSEFDRVGGFDPIGYDDDWTLSSKLGTVATAAPNAHFYHRNPDSLLEVWHQARWTAKRAYKLRALGKIITLIRTSLPVSLITGIVTSISIGLPAFVYFKLLYDTAIFKSVLFSFISTNHYK